MLNRSPFPAMNLKSNKSGLWRHMLELVTGWDYVASVQAMSRDMIKLQLSQHFCRATKIFCRATWVSCRVGVTLCCDFYRFRSCKLSVCLILQCCDIRHNFFAVVWYIIKHLFYETAWSILFWNHKNDVRSLVKVHREYSPAARILHTKID